MVVAICFAAGIFLDWISIILLFIPLFMPIIMAFNLDEIWFRALVLLIIQTSYLTPPPDGAGDSLLARHHSQENCQGVHISIVDFIKKRETKSL